MTSTFFKTNLTAEDRLVSFISTECITLKSYKNWHFSILDKSSVYCMLICVWKVSTLWSDYLLIILYINLPAIIFPNIIWAWLLNYRNQFLCILEFWKKQNSFKHLLNLKCSIYNSRWMKPTVYYRVSTEVVFYPPISHLIS